MTRLFTLIGLAALAIAAPQPEGAAEVGPRGESLRAAPTTEAPSQGTLTRAWSRVDQVRSADASGFVPVEPFDVGPGPSDHRSDGEGAEGSPHHSRLSLLPFSRAPPA